VGADEAAAGTATWKDLDTGRQETAPVAEVAAALCLLLAGQ
jgi:histidyl-tRNA synthetase